MKKSVLLGASTLATAGVVGGGVLLSGAANSSGSGGKSLEQSEEQVERGPENALPQRSGQPTPPPSKPTFVFRMNPDPLPTIDQPAVEEFPEEEDETEPTFVPLTVEHDQAPEDTQDQELPENQAVNYTITDPALVLVESCEKALTQDQLKYMINFLYLENASLDDYLVNLQKAKQYLDNLMAGVTAAVTRSFGSSKPYSCETLNLYYKQWLGLWDEKIKSAEGESVEWERLRNKYIDDILKVYFWKVFQQEHDKYQAKLPDIRKSMSQT